MDNSRRFTLTDFCIICGVTAMLSCMLFPREVAPAAASADQTASNPLASGVGSHGKHAEPYATTVVSVRPPQDGQPGRINMVAYNNTSQPQPVLVSQYATTVPIVVDGIDKDNKNVDVAATSTIVEARFTDLAPGQRLSAGIRYHLAPPQASRSMFGWSPLPFVPRSRP